MRSILAILLFFAVAYGAMLILVYLFQSRLVYLPNFGGDGFLGTPADVGLEFENVFFRTADGETLHAWHVPAESSMGTVLFCHGNAGNISHRLESIRLFHDLGLNVFIFDYRGYGRSSGRPHEAGTYRDAEAAWDHLVGERGVPGERVVVFGRSLGAAVAAHLAGQRAPGALILESPFTSAPDLGAKVYFWLPVRLLSRFRYATVEFVRDVTAPVLVIHSREDEIVPFEHGLAVYRAAGEPKDVLEIAGGHNDGFMVSGARYREGLAAFLGEHLER